MRLRAYLIFPVAVIFLAAFSSLAQFTYADSVVWSGSDKVLLANSVMPNYAGADIWYIPLIDPLVTVQYRAFAMDALGASVCNGTVLQGSQVVLQFDPLQPQDVVWNVTGGSWDTPNGSWASNATISDVQCRPEEQVSSFSTVMWGLLQLYTPFVANPPQRSVSLAGGILDCDTSQVASTGRATCTATATGNGSVSFNFSSTFGKFYFRSQHTAGYASDGSPAPACTGYLPSGYYMGQSNTGKAYLELFSTGDYAAMSVPSATQAFQAAYVEHMPPTTSNFSSAINAAAPYQFPIPAQQISCPITVLPSVGSPPAPPALQSNGQCTVGIPHTISVVSSDPDNDNLKYGIDWDGSGTVDQWIPGSGYVASGSTQTANRTYAITGSKTVKVLAQDENGNSSSWATLSFNCAGLTTATLNEGGDDTGGDDTQLLLLPDLDLRVIPSLVRSGNTTKVNWSSENVRSCTVTGQNGDAWTGLLSPLGGQVSKPITTETTYTLTCIDLEGETQTKHATVRILHTFQEL